MPPKGEPPAKKAKLGTSKTWVGMQGIPMRFLEGEKYFSLSFHDEKHYHVRCLNCPNEKILKCTRGSSSNALTHLRLLHPDLHKEYMESAKPQCSAQDKESTTQEDIKRAICDFIVNGAHPLSVVEEESFKHLVKAASKGEFHSISRVTLMKELDRKYEAYLLEVKTELAKYEWVCTTGKLA